MFPSVKVDVVFAFPFAKTLANSDDVWLLLWIAESWVSTWDVGARQSDKLLDECKVC